MTYDGIWRICDSFVWSATELECVRVGEPRGRTFSQQAADELRAYLQQAVPVHDCWFRYCKPLVEGVRLFRNKPELSIERAHLFLLVQMRLIERFAQGETLSSTRLTKLIKFMTGAQPAFRFALDEEQRTRRVA